MINPSGIPIICILMTIMANPCRDNIATADNHNINKIEDKIEVTDLPCTTNKWECKTRDIILQMTISTTKMTWLLFKSSMSNRNSIKLQWTNIQWGMKINHKNIKIIWTKEERAENLNNFKTNKIDKDRIQGECKMLMVFVTNPCLIMKVKKYLKSIYTMSILK